MIELRPYQEKFIDNIRNQFRAGKNHVVGVAPCGAGKTIMTGWMIRETVRRGKSAVFFVHRRELIEQTSQTFTALGIPHGIIAGGIKPNFIYPVQIASVQTLINRINSIRQPDLLVCDECHHILAKSYLSIVNRWNNSFLLGVTATPERTGGVKLGDVFNSMVLAPTAAELIKLGNLTNFDYFDAEPSKFGKVLATVGVRHGDYDNRQLEEVMDNVTLIGNAVDNYIEKAAGTSAICYCVNVNHSVKVASAFNSAGIKAAQVDGKTPRDERDYIVNRFRQGKIKVLCNAELFGEGFDVPNCDTVILSRPTKSLTLHIQQSMRSMRPNPDNPNKRAIIIDCVGNWKRHGLPDTERDWSLDPNKPKRKGDGEFPQKVCPKCGYVTSVNALKCKMCGYEFPDTFQETDSTDAKLIHSSDNQILHVEPSPHVINAPATIEEFLTIAKRRNYKDYWAVVQALNHCRDYKEVLHIAQVMGYKDGWAYYKWQELKKGLAKSPAL